MLIYLTGLRALVVVVFEGLMPFVLWFVIAFGLLYHCTSDVMLL
jgi:hypothetical protein